ncbi:hypothetical protein RJ40_02415 [Methanofollis aquaemaris]|uniref:Uncharacterized protein n=1 Tax=Methanofollis aquaemaris TaxID=126734 RepID=A0A8A3S3W0_9EURY|nr:hypothetical protein RJ40_02415 [Methanofollis aquaemaris]
MHALDTFIYIPCTPWIMSKVEIPRWTNVKVSGQTWRRLSGEKIPGESFDMTINRLIDTVHSQESE